MNVTVTVGTLLPGPGVGCGASERHAMQSSTLQELSLTGHRSNNTSNGRNFGLLASSIRCEYPDGVVWSRVIDHHITFVPPPSTTGPWLLVSSPKAICQPKAIINPLCGLIHHTQEAIQASTRRHEQQQAYNDNNNLLVVGLILLNCLKGRPTALQRPQFVAASTSDLSVLSIANKHGVGQALQATS